MPLSAETLLITSLGINGTLLMLLISLVVYVFLTLRQEVRGVSAEVSELSKNRVKLVHVDDCRLTARRIHERLDGCETEVRDLTERVARTEALLHGRGGSHEPF